MDMDLLDYLRPKALSSHGVRVREASAVARLLEVSDETDAGNAARGRGGTDWTARIARLMSLQPMTREVRATLASCRGFVDSLDATLAPKPKKAGVRRRVGDRRSAQEVGEMVHHLRGYLGARDAASKAASGAVR